MNSQVASPKTAANVTAPPVGVRMNGQVALAKTSADVTAPAAGIVMHPAYAKAVGQFAYIWGWPMVNM